MYQISIHPLYKKSLKKYTLSTTHICCRSYYVVKDNLHKLVYRNRKKSMQKNNVKNLNSMRHSAISTDQRIFQLYKTSKICQSSISCGLEGLFAWRGEFSGEWLRFLQHIHKISNREVGVSANAKTGQILSFERTKHNCDASLNSGNKTHAETMIYVKSNAAKFKTMSEI